MQHHTHRIADLYRGFTCQTWIGPGLSVINAEHVIEEAEIEALLVDHPLIAEGHMRYFVRGLADGVKGDFASALHFLVPQVESLLRALLHRNGVITTDLQGVGIEQEWTLGRVLEQPALVDALDASMVFELRDLMVASPAGANVRNTLAHGLLPYGATRGVDGVYLWWVLLRLVLGTSPMMDTIAERHRPRGVPEGR